MFEIELMFKHLVTFLNVNTILNLKYFREIFLSAELKAESELW